MSNADTHGEGRGTWNSPVVGPLIGGALSGLSAQQPSDSKQPSEGTTKGTS